MADETRVAHGLHVDLTIGQCDELEQLEFQKHWRQAQAALESRANAMADPPGQLRLDVIKSDDAPSWRINAALYAPGSVMVAEAEGDTPREAIDRIAVRLTEHIDRQESRPEEPTEPLREIEQQNLSGIASLLSGWRRARRSDAFLAFLTPLIASLGPYIRREMKIREDDGQLLHGGLALDDVLDELLLQAWDRFPQRQQQDSIALWLMQMADEITLRLGQPAAEVSLDEPVETPSTEPNESRQFEWVDQVNYYEQTELQELLPGEEGLRAWEPDDMEARQTELARVLGRLDRQQRQAIALNAAQGFSAERIADFQNRSADDVEADLQLAINALRRELAADDEGDVEEAFDRRELRDRRKRARGR